ncbi:MAG: type IV secretory system conjugative DNA transfer family protein [Corallococcus sp.]|nr:type IV secretory system conjugative DNA transfer family protein [Corallococcus sp.]
MIIDDAILEGYESAELYRYDEPSGDFPYTCAYEDLPSMSVSGVLKANRYVNGKLIQTYAEQENHVGIIAATRQGKTTSGVIPMVISNARKKVKCNMILSDPKGEVYRHTAATLKAEGYRVVMLNLRDYRHSECWNPLTPLFRKFKRAMSLADRVQVVTENGKKRYRFLEITYRDKSELDRAISLEQAAQLDDVYNDIDLFGAMMVTIEDKRDPMWERGAREIFKGFLHAMLEDSLLKENPITEETFSFNTIFTIFATFSGENSNFDHGYFSDRPKTSRAYATVKEYLFIEAERTRSSYTTTFAQKMSEYMNIAIRRITSCNSFEVSDLGRADQPIALFLCYRDELKIHFQLISLFVQDAYKALIDLAGENSDSKLTTPFYFILDEFGNFPQLYNFENFISACAGRNIWFVLVLQSYAQLNAVYGYDTAKIILDNLNVKIFFGSNNWATISEFSEGCGLRTRLSPESALNGDSEEIEHYKIETIPLVTKSMLCKLKSGECIVTEANAPVLFSRLERYYLCPEYKDLPLTNEKEYACSVNPLDPKYTYVYNEKNNRLRSIFDF